MSRRFDLVIFDCDGVLVDSERLAVRVEAAVLGELGWPLTEDEVVERFVGRSAAYMHAEVERALDRRIDWGATFGVRHAEAYRTGLQAVEGVAHVLDGLAAVGVATCVASSSTHDSIASKLALTGLAGRFGPRVFSVDDVARAKPAPDVFVHAAATLGVPPPRCAVVEDSPAGVEAGLAAKMAVFAYAGGVVGPDRLAASGVSVFDAMASLPSLLA